MTDSLLARAKLITGATDSELAEVVGLSGPTTTSYANGHRREYLNAAQIEALSTWLEAYADGVRRAVDEFVMFA